MTRTRCKPPPGPRQQFDFSLALARLDGDAGLLREQMESFLQDVPGVLADLRASVARCEAEALLFAAQRLKGLAAGLDAERAAECAARLETMGRNGDLHDAEIACHELEQHVEYLEEALRTYLTLHESPRPQPAAKTENP
jgi:two-component system, sensor histidine kinase and response regulator